MYVYNVLIILLLSEIKILLDGYSWSRHFMHIICCCVLLTVPFVCYLLLKQCTPLSFN